MITDHLRLHVDRVDAEVSAQMQPKPQAVEKRAGTQHTLVAGYLPRDIGKGVGRIADGNQDRLRSGPRLS